MSGKDLFNKYTDLDQEAFSNDELAYAQTLMTILVNIGNAIYPLLERAEVENKRLSIDESKLPELWDSFDATDVVLA